MKRKRGNEKQKQLLVDLSEYESFIVPSADKTFLFSLPCRPVVTLEEAETLANSLQFSSGLAPEAGTVDGDYTDGCACFMDKSPNNCSDVSRLENGSLETNRNGTECVFIISGAECKCIDVNHDDDDDDDECDVSRCFNGISGNHESKCEDAASQDDDSKCQLNHNKRCVDGSECVPILADTDENQNQICASNNADVIRSEQGMMHTMEYGKDNVVTELHYEATCDDNGFRNHTDSHVHDCEYASHEYGCGNTCYLRNSNKKLGSKCILEKHDRVGSSYKELHRDKSPENKSTCNDYFLAGHLNRQTDGCRNFAVVCKGTIRDRISLPKHTNGKHNEQHINWCDEETINTDHEEYIVNSVFAPYGYNSHKMDGSKCCDSSNRLLEAKLKIMFIRLKYGADVWSLASQVTNPYEALPSFSVHVLNRAFFKMWELMQIFPNIVAPAAEQSRLLSAHLCEGPGGFIQALLMHRMQKAKTSSSTSTRAVEGCNISVTKDLFEKSHVLPVDDVWFAITLATSYDKQTSLKMQTEKLKRFCHSFAEGHIHYGADGSGDIMNPDNISAFVWYVLVKTKGEKMHLITGDGAFDVSDDPSMQEESHAQLLFCELVIALQLQCHGGALVMKLFDCYTDSTKTILLIISSLYAEVEIVKLRTSRVCNSERYVVARGFHGLPLVLEQKLMMMAVAWYKSRIEGSIGSISYSGTPSSKFLSCLKSGNAAIANDQITSILQAVDVAEQLGDKLLAKAEHQRKRIICVLRRKLKTLSKHKENALSLIEDLSIPLSIMH